MKKIFLILICFSFVFAHAQTLKGGVLEEYIPSGFYGSWGVISKLESSNNPGFFNFESRDVWNLSGHGNILVLENLKSGAYSEIIVKEKTKDGKTLKFNRQKTIKEKENKIIFKEQVSFSLNKNNFSGFDDYTFEKYDKNNKLIEKNIAKYVIKGTKISGKTPSE